MINIKFTLTGLDNLNNVTKIDLEEILDEASAVLISRILNRFMAETDTSGKPWIPSKAGMRRRLTGGGGTLLDTRRLYNSIQIHKDSANKRRISTDVPYAEQHQLGLNGMVKREFIGASDDDVSMIRQVVELRIQEQLKG